MTRTRGTGRIFRTSWRDPRTGERRPAATLAIRYYDRRRHQHITEYGFKTKPEAEKRLKEVLDVPLPRGETPKQVLARELLWLRRLIGPTQCDLPGRFVLAARRPLVYALFRGEDALYVGMSEQGLARPLSRSHAQMANVMPDDQLRIWPCDSAEEALALEQHLIVTLNPVRNGTYAKR